MLPKNGFTIEYVKGAAARRYWSVLIPFFLISTATVVYCIRTPRIYTSKTVVLVEPQEVPTDYVRSTVTSDASSRLNTIKEQIMSRPRLEAIIESYDLYAEIRSKRTMFDAVEEMRKNIHVDVKNPDSRRDNTPSSFEISFDGQVPAQVQQITRDIANLFIEDDLKLREQQASGTSKFLERELERMREELRKKEELVRNFKENNVGLLPEQMENNYRILAQLQQSHDSLNSTLQQAEDRKVLLRGQFNRIHSLNFSTLESDSERDEAGGQVVALSLGELEGQLEKLKARYSDKHPDVILLQKRIEKWKQGESMEAKSGAVEGVAARSQPSEATKFLLVQNEDLKTQLALADQEIRNLMKEKRHTSEQIESYKQRIENGPRAEQMFLDLRRDYEEASENYQSLLNKKLEAELSENLERTRKGEQFVILEPANLPQKPSKPNVLKILGLGFMVALGSGFGLAYLREKLDPTFWHSKDLQAEFDLPVLATIPTVARPKRKYLAFAKGLLTVGALLSMAGVLVFALHVLWKVDPTVFLIP